MVSAPVGELSFWLRREKPPRRYYAILLFFEESLPRCRRARDGWIWNGPAGFLIQARILPLMRRKSRASSMIPSRSSCLQLPYVDQRRAEKHINVATGSHQRPN